MREKEIRWLHYEGELPAEEELKDINIVVLIGWRNKWDDSIKPIVAKSKLLVLGSAANVVTALLGGSLH
jgi:hypothetical protein